MFKNLFVKAFGALAATGVGRTAIASIAFDRPLRHLYDRDGSIYMQRYAVVTEGSWVSKVLEFFTGYASARLHWIARADHDRDLHNHPFRYRTFILAGGYSEVRQASVFSDRYERFVGEGNSATGSPLIWHRISDMGPAGTWSLFFMTQNEGEWGFLVHDKKYPWMPTYVQSETYFVTRGFDKTNPR